MIKKHSLVLVVTFITILCWHSITYATDKVVVTGSSTIAPLIADIGKRFEKQNPNVRIDVQTGGSSRGVIDARSGLADVGMASRALKPEENKLKSFTIALDGIGLIVHKKNPIKTLSNQQVIDIYTGKITNWNEVGGNDSRITVVNKAEGRSTLELFLNYYHLKNSNIKPHVIIGDNQQGIKTVAGNPDAIGYVSIGTAEFDVSNGIPIKLLPLNGVKASVENVRNGHFPLSRPLNLVTKAAPQGLAKQFIDFAKSKAVYDIVEAHYFVPPAR